MTDRHYAFYGAGQGKLSPVNAKYKEFTSPEKLYENLCLLWSADTCAPRLKTQWSPQNVTLGQCSITAFLAQDVFGGKVYGIQRKDGNFHCYNVVGEYVFDLTSEQFGDEVLCYTDNPEQFRKVHFAKQEKKERYEYLKRRLDAMVGVDK